MTMTAAIIEMPTGRAREMTLERAKQIFNSTGGFNMDQEIWYKLQISRKGDDDWFAYGSTTFDSPESARQYTGSHSVDKDHELRIVKVTQTEEVIAA